MEDNTVFWFS